MSTETTSSCPNQWLPDAQGICQEVAAGSGLYVTLDACNQAQKLKLEGLQCQKELAVATTVGGEPSEGEDYESMYNTTYALSITFGVLFLVALILLCVLVPLAQKGKLK